MEYAKACDRVAVVNASDAQGKLVGFGFAAAVGERLEGFGLAWMRKL